MEAEAERDAILAALMALGLTSRQVLYYRYCTTDSYSNYKRKSKCQSLLQIG
jgi:hypothetical protein